MVTLTCAEARQIVFDYLDGELDPATARAVERHRDSCRNCPPLVQAIIAMLGRLRHLPEATPAEGFLARLAAVTHHPTDHEGA
jgi:anti-sigma factor RsiW